MKRWVQLSLLSLMLVSVPAICVQSLNVERGIGLVDRQKRSEYARESLVYALFYRYIRDKEGTGGLAAMTDKEQPTKNFALSRNTQLYGIEMDLKDIQVTRKNRYDIDLDDIGEVSRLGVWSIDRWDDFVLEDHVKKRYEAYDQRLPEPSVAVAPEGEQLGAYLGCIPATPLRYGDVTNDGQSELIIITAGDLLVFSPRTEQITFSSRLHVDDTISKEKTKKIIDSGSRPYGDRPQYSSRILENAAQGHHDHLRAGYRGYAKLFWGDFNDNGQRDIIEWRKLYESLERDAGKDGFELKKETFVHHEFQNGEFHRRETETEQIQQWLTDKEWVWAEGWPNYSECEDEKGQLIPELHDPLLNDPEVLKGVDPETMTFVEEEGGQKE